MPDELATRDLTFFKYQGLGNDFLVLLGYDQPLDAELARALCDRHRGWGADGLLRGAVLPGPHRPLLTFELRNADGSEAEMSGNGLRCLVHAAIDEGLVVARAGGQVRVETPAGPREVEVRELGDGYMWATSGMGAPLVKGAVELCNVGNGQLLVDVGNPHLVVLGPDPSVLDISTLGPRLSEAGSAGGLNVEFVTLGPGRDEITMRVWERGVGETLACGTGSVAAATAVNFWGRTGRKVTVNQPGGAADVELLPDGTATLTGPSRRIGCCSFDLPVLHEAARGGGL